VLHAETQASNSRSAFGFFELCRNIEGTIYQGDTPAPQLLQSLETGGIEKRDIRKIQRKGLTRLQVLFTECSNSGNIISGKSTTQNQHWVGRIVGDSLNR